MRGTLNRRRVLDAALAVVDAEGLPALTMRRLGQELGVEAMSLYRHVPSKEALLDGLVELIVLEIDVPADGDADWEAALRRIARSYRRAAHAHPSAFPLVTTRPLNTPEALRRVDATLGILRRAGFDEEMTVVAFRTVAAYVRGLALEEVTNRGLGGQADAGPHSAEDFPRLHELAPWLVAADRDAEFERGLELITVGLRAALAR